MGLECRQDRRKTRKAYRILVQKPLGKLALRRQKRRWKDKIKMNLREASCEDGGFCIMDADPLGPATTVLKYVFSGRKSVLRLPILLIPFTQVIYFNPVITVKNVYTYTYTVTLSTVILLSF
jgi:hypothetical protein